MKLLVYCFAFPCYNVDKQEKLIKEVNTISTMLAEDILVITPRIKLLVAQYEIKVGRKVEYREIAEAVKVSQQQFSAWVNGRGWPRMDKAYRLARYLGCTVDELYEYKEE